MQPDPTILLEKIGLDRPPVGFYDAPEAAPFEPLVEPVGGRRACLFAFYRSWLAGKTLRLSRDRAGCGGAAHWLFGVESRTRDEFVRFLVDEEGLKASHELMGRWLDHGRPYEPEHENLFIGPLRAGQYGYLKTVTFMVNPDQLSVLMTGAQYHSAPDDPPPVIASFGSGCSQLVALFDELNAPQSMVGATDIAMRKYLDPDLLAFTVTRPMFERLCSLDEKSFLYKRFWRDLQKARAG